MKLKETLRKRQESNIAFEQSESAGKKTTKGIKKYVKITLVILAALTVIGAFLPETETTTVSSETQNKENTIFDLTSLLTMNSAEIQKKFGTPSVEEWEDGESFTLAFPIGLRISHVEAEGVVFEENILYIKGGASQASKEPLQLLNIRLDMTMDEVKQEHGNPLVIMNAADMELADAETMGLNVCHIYFIQDRYQLGVFYERGTEKVSAISYALYNEELQVVPTNGIDLCGYVGLYGTSEELEQLFSVTAVESRADGGKKVITTAATFELMSDGYVYSVSPNSRYFHVFGIRLGDNINDVENDGFYSLTEISMDRSQGNACYVAEDIFWSEPCYIDICFSSDGTITAITARSYSVAP